MCYLLLFPFFLFFFGCGSDSGYRFFGPEDSPEKNAYILEMDPIYTEGVEITLRLKKAVFNWNQQANNPDWETQRTEFNTLSELIVRQQAKAKKVIPKKEDLQQPHANYLQAWDLCLNGINMILTYIDTQGQQGETLEANKVIDQGIKNIEAYPRSLVYQTIYSY